MTMSGRFRGFLPVVIDLETGGFDARRNPILELAAVEVRYVQGVLEPAARHHWAVHPFQGGVLDPASMKITGIDPNDPGRNAEDEGEVLRVLFSRIRQSVKEQNCQRAILVAHNAAFDQHFLNQALLRTGIKRNPFHAFTFIDTASLAAVSYGHTVLREACARADIPFDPDQAHSALYDAERTADLFCSVVNAWDRRGPGESPMF